MFDKIAQGRKGVVNILELITVLIMLFLSFSIFFPKADYRNRWEDAYMILKARDMMLLLERTGELHEYAFEPQMIESLFSTLFPESSLIVWAETEGGIKGEIKIACDCSSDTMTMLTQWMNGLKLNERSISVSFCSANLGSPEACIYDSDVLLIWGQKSLQSYEQMLLDYISSGKGIVEVMDFKAKNEVSGDSVQGNIFGLNWVDIERDTMDHVEFPRKPIDAEETGFGPYKYFYHIPLPLKTTGNGNTITGCGYNPAKNGTLNISSGDYWFAVCNDTHAWFDTNDDNTYDRCVNASGRTPFQIGSYSFVLNYINSDSSIAVSFRPSYEFDDFLGFVVPPGTPDPPGKAIGIYRVSHIEPVDSDIKKTLLTSVSTSPAMEFPSLILNRFGDTGVAWIPEFSENGYTDDEKLLMTSLLLWASNKQATSRVTNLRFGYLTSFVNVKNIDMFEVYKFSLGLGYPF